MDNQEFLKLNSNRKIEEIIRRVKQSVLDGVTIEPVFYLFDQDEKLHVLDIEEPFLLKEDRQNILRQLVKEKIKEMQSRNLHIDKILFLREGFYNPRHHDKLNMNLEKDFGVHNANEAVIITLEDIFNFEIKVFDLIKITDQGRQFSVLSETPIEQLEFCKIDPEYNIKTNYINLIAE